MKVSAWMELIECKVLLKLSYKSTFVTISKENCPSFQEKTPRHKQICPLIKNISCLGNKMRSGSTTGSFSDVISGCKINWQASPTLFKSERSLLSLQRPSKCNLHHLLTHPLPEFPNTDKDSKLFVSLLWNIWFFSTFARHGGVCF